MKHNLSLHMHLLLYTELSYLQCNKYIQNTLKYFVSWNISILWYIILNYFMTYYKFMLMHVFTLVHKSQYNCIKHCAVMQFTAKSYTMSILI